MNAAEYAQFQALEARVAELEGGRKAFLSDVADLVAQIAGAHAAVLQLTQDLRGMPRFGLQIPPVRELAKKLGLFLKEENFEIVMPVDTGVPEMVKRKRRAKKAA